MISIRSFVLLLVILLSVSAKAGKIPNKAVVDIGEQVFKPTRTVVTPHIAWVNPYIKGKLKVLFMDSHLNMREAVEFAQRLEMDYEFFSFSSSSTSLKPMILRGGYYKGDQPGDKEKRLKAVLKSDYDLIVMGNVSWPRLPDYAKEAIMEKVKNGTGFVRSSTGHRSSASDPKLDQMLKNTITVPAAVAEGIPWKALPVFQEYKDERDFLNHTLAASQFGKGMVINIKGYKPCDDQILSPGFVKNTLWHRWYMWWISLRHHKEKRPELTRPFMEIKLLDYDYYLEYLIKVMLFASHRMPDVAITDNGLIHTCQRKNFDKLSFTLNAKKSLDSLNAKMVIRDRDNDILLEETKNNITLNEGNHTLEFDTKNIPDGEYFADLWLLRDKQVVTFGSKVIKVISNTRIASATLTDDNFKTTDKITGVINVAGGNTDDLKLEINWKDSEGRLVKKITLPVDGKSVQFELAPVDGPVAVWQFLTLNLWRDNTLLDREKLAFTYNNLYLNTAIRLGAWKWSRMSYLQYHYYRALYDIGFDSVGAVFTTKIMLHDYFGVGPKTNILTGRYEMATLANLRYIPPLMRITDLGMYLGKGGKIDKAYLDTEKKDPIKKPEDYIRYPCLNDPKYNQLAKERICKMVKHFKKGSTREYLFDQEPCFSQAWHRKFKEVCHCPRCQEYFRIYLKSAYHSIQAVNNQWGTNFEKFEDIKSVTFADTIKNRKLGPQWIDFRIAMSDVFNNFYKNLTNEIWKIQPNARTGDAAPIYSGFRSGDTVDIWKFSRWTKLSAPYPGITEKIRADFALPDALISRGLWWGPARGRGATVSKWHPWNDLFEGANFWYSYPGDTGNLLAHDLSMFKDLKIRMKQLNEIKDGVGRLIHEAKRGDSGIAMLYSYSSLQAWALTEGWGDSEHFGSTFAGKITTYTYRNNVGAWMSLLRDVTGPFKFISYEQLGNGILENSNFKMLVLPLCQALSPKQVEAIKSFVNKGGSLIADLRPGVWDAHGKPYKISPLDDVFGVKQDTASANIRKTDIKITHDGSTIDYKTLIDKSLAVSSGNVLGQATSNIPLMVENTYGKGKTILMNFAITNYLDLKQINRTAVQPVCSKYAPMISDFFKKIFKTMPLTEEVTIDNTPWQLHHYYYKDGNNLYVGLIQDLPEALKSYSALPKPLKTEKKVTLNLPAAAHLYDLREGRYIGYSDKTEVYIRLGCAKIISALPYEVRTIALNMPETVKQGDAINYEAQIKATAAPGKHVLRVELLDPSGKSIRHYSKNYTCPKGQLEAKIQLALNEKPGQYTLKVKDIATGIVTKQNITIER